MAGGITPRLAAVGLVALLAACAQPLHGPRAWTLGAAPPPPSASLHGAHPLASRHMVAAAHPLAVAAGQRTLDAGGSALDAAIAVQMMLSLVEPQSSGIGGGAFLMLWDGRAIQAWDGRETAPAGVTDSLFLRPNGQPLSFIEAAVGGRPVGVPGVVHMLYEAHRRHGKLPWSQLFVPAIEAAESGFSVSARLHEAIKSDPHLSKLEGARRYFFDSQGQPWPVGHRLQNPALAQILRAIALNGPSAFYGGSIAQDLVTRVREHPTNPGSMTLADLQGYRSVSRAALCTPWERYRVCGFPPPSSGHLTMMQILGMLSAMKVGPPTRWVGSSPDVVEVAWAHRYLEASKLAFADRARYIADPDFVAPPGGDWGTLLSSRYLATRAQLIGERAMGTAAAGEPGVERSAWGVHAAQPEFGTSHLSVVDSGGQVVSMTTTVEAVWGSRILADGASGLPGGYILNNQLTDFSFAPRDAQGRWIANRVEPGKRPRSSMNPTLVFGPELRSPILSIGSPGGAAIIHYTTKAMLLHLQAGADLQSSVSSANLANLNGPSQLEKGRFSSAFIEALKQRGHVVQETDLVSGTQAISQQGRGWTGAADPRREGVVLGR